MLGSCGRSKQDALIHDNLCEERDREKTGGFIDLIVDGNLARVRDVPPNSDGGNSSFMSPDSFARYPLHSRDSILLAKSTVLSV